MKRLNPNKISKLNPPSLSLKRHQSWRGGGTLSHYTATLDEPMEHERTDLLQLAHVTLHELHLKRRTVIFHLLGYLVVWVDTGLSEEARPFEGTRV